jgi:hypothetical protein
MQQEKAEAVLNLLRISHYDVAIMMSFTIILDHMKRNTGDQTVRQTLNDAAKKTNEALSKHTNIQLPGLPEHDARREVEYIGSLSTEEFMRQYEIACKRLGISRKNRLLTLTAYQKGIQKAYKIYVSDMEEHGFMTKWAELTLRKFLIAMNG